MNLSYVLTIIAIIMYYFTIGICILHLYITYLYINLLRIQENVETVLGFADTQKGHKVV